MKKQIQQGINVILKVGDKIVGGQAGIQLDRKAQAIDITNKINGDWQENLSGLKTWSLSCQGVYLIDSEGYDLAEQAYLNNENIQVELQITDKKYVGEAIITGFPLSSGYSTQYKYNIQLLGNGALEEI